MPPGATSVTSTGACARSAAPATRAAVTDNRTMIFIGAHCRLRTRRPMKTMSTMQRSVDRILTTHAGRLDGPPELAAMLRLSRAEPIDMARAVAIVPPAIADIVKRQKDTGVDIVSDGELGKLGFGLTYYGRRYTGLSSRKIKEGEPGWMSRGSGERLDFADFYKDLGGGAPAERVVVRGPITFVGQAEVAT